MHTRPERVIHTSDPPTGCTLAEGDADKVERIDVSMRSSAGGLAWRVFLAAGIVAAVAYPVLPEAPGAFLYEAVGIASVIAIVAGARMHAPTDPLPWHLIAIGVALLTLGDSIFTANELVFEITPFPSIADVAYLGAYPFLCVGVVLLVRRRMPGQDAGSLIDALIVSVACGIASWVFLMEPYARDRGMSGLEQLVAMAYPAADILLLVVVLQLLFVPGPRPVAHRLFFFGLVLTLVGDTGFAWRSLNGSYSSPDPNDALFLVAYAFIAAAALHPSLAVLDRRSRGSARPGVWRLAVLGAAALTPAGFFAGEASRDHVDHAPVIVAGAVIVPLLALVRVALLLRDVERSSRLDPLTLLPNRSLLFDRITEALARAKRNGTSVALLYVDLDRFKLVNDAFGHSVGDELLQRVGERITGALRRSDTVARVGGDEFVVLCEDLDDTHGALAAADRLAMALIEPIVVGGTTFNVSASVGVAIGTTGDAPDPLLNDADAAMYRAKERGRGRAELFEPSMRQLGVAGTTRLDEDLRHALERDELLLHFQPQIDLSSGQVVGVEALLRWRHPEWGLLPPVTVVPIAEETGLIVAIGEWVIDEACRSTRRWLDAGVTLEMTVNLSARQLNDPLLSGKIASALRRWDVPADQLVVDIRDSVSVASDVRATTTLHDLRHIGVHVAIDDDDGVVASVDVLRMLQADRFKVDRSLVVAATADDGDTRTIGAVCALAGALGMRVVAEGVETRSQRRILADLGCHEGLGHLWAPALPPGAVLDQLMGRAFTIDAIR
jgi:diguanylate cyclase (GGDEF)-like protein